MLTTKMSTHSVWVSHYQNCSGATIYLLLWYSTNRSFGVHCSMSHNALILSNFILQVRLFIRLSKLYRSALSAIDYQFPQLICQLACVDGGTAY